MPRLILTSLVALVIGACSGGCSPAPTSDTADLAAIKSVREQYEAAFNAADPVKLGEVYTADAVSLSDHLPAIVGHDAIVSMHRARMKMGVYGLALSSQETKVMSDWAFDRGEFMTTLNPTGGGAQIMSHGKYLVLLQKGTDGKWKLAREISNSNEALPPPTEMPGTSAPSSSSQK